MTTLLFGAFVVVICEKMLQYFRSLINCIYNIPYYLVKVTIALVMNNDNDSSNINNSLNNSTEDKINTSNSEKGNDITTQQKENKSIENVFIMTLDGNGKYKIITKDKKI